MKWLNSLWESIDIDSMDQNYLYNCIKYIDRILQKIDDIWEQDEEERPPMFYPYKEVEELKKKQRYMKKILLTK